MAENRAAFSLRRRRSLGFSKCRWLRTIFSVPSRSIFFFNRRSAFSTDSPFFSLISVKLIHFLSERPGDAAATMTAGPLRSGLKRVFSGKEMSTGKNTARERLFDRKERKQPKKAKEG